MKNRKESVNQHAAIAAFAKVVRDMPDDQYEKLVKGDLSFLSAPKKSGGREIKAAKAKGNGRAVPVLDAQKREAIESELDSAPSRDAGARIVENAFSRKDELFAFAKYLDLAVQKKDSIARIRRKIVEFTVGRRLDSEAIRGGYTVK